MWKALVCFSAPMALALGAVVGCNRQPAAGGFAMGPAPVTTAPVSTEDVPLYLDEIGKTTAAEVVNIKPQVSGKIIERSFTDGANLKTKEKLFEIDPRPFQASLHAASAQLEQSKAQLKNANTEFARVSSLLASKAVAQQDYDNATDAVDVANANEKAGEAAVEAAQLNLDYCTISSPLDGRAGERLVDVGNVVTANETSLLVIQKLSPLYIDFTVSETDLPSVRKNMADKTLKVVVQSPDDPGVSDEGNLDFLDNAVQDGTGTIKLRATLPNTDGKFWPGQFVHVKLILATLKDAMMIPSEAVQIGQDGAFVFVIGPGNVAIPSPIVEGQRQGDKVVITKGIAVGQSVVLSGQLMVIPGRPVMVIPPTPPGGMPGGAPGAAPGGAPATHQSARASTQASSAEAH